MRMLVPYDSVHWFVEYNSPAESSNTASTLGAVNLRFTGGGFVVSECLSYSPASSAWHGYPWCVRNLELLGSRTGMCALVFGVVVARPVRLSPVCCFFPVY